LNSEHEVRLEFKLIHDFMDTIILRILTEESYISGNELIKYFHQEFNLMISQGTVYSALCSLERQGLIRGSFIGWRRIYKLLKQGGEFFDELCAARRHNNAVFLSIFPILQSQGFKQPISSVSHSLGSESTETGGEFLVKHY
jgi:DNA-binding PadR family transcriptional regulator